MHRLSSPLSSSLNYFPVRRFNSGPASREDRGQRRLQGDPAADQQRQADGLCGAGSALQQQNALQLRVEADHRPG